MQAPVFDILTFKWLAGVVDTSDPAATYLSASVAEKFFGTADYATLLGRTINLANKHDLVVKGIYADFPKNTSFPFQMIVDYEKQEGVNAYFGKGTIWGRLNGGTQSILTIAEGADPRLVQQDIINSFEKHNVIDGYRLELQSMAQIHVEPIGSYSGGFETKYKIIAYALAVVLALIGSINFINLTTARAIKRAKEVGIRKVMGGRRSDLIAQFLLETLVLVGISLVAGFLLASQFLDLFGSLVSTSPTLAFISLAEWALFAGLVVIGMTLLSGLYPALILSRFSALTAIKTRISNIDTQSKVPVRKILVGLQFGFSICLMISAIVIFSQMRFMKGYDMGFETDGILQLLFPEPDQERQQRLKTRLESLPEVNLVSIHLGSPIANTNNTDRYFNPEHGEDQSQQVNVKNIDENYLELFDLELIAGRNITPNDPRENIIVTEKTLREFGYGEPSEAIGKELHATWGQKNKIVGVVKDFNAYSLRQTTLPVAMNYRAQSFYEMALEFAPTADKLEAMQKVEEIWDQVYPELLIEYSYLDDEIASRYQFEEIMAKSISFFVLIALVISILGLYGLTDYLANSKRKEIGIRKVIGATIAQILSLFAKEVTWLLLIAFVISGTATYFLMNLWLEGFEYRITIGWEIILSALVATVLVSLMTMGTRSLNAAKVNPVDVLKDE